MPLKEILESNGRALRLQCAGLTRDGRPAYAIIGKSPGGDTPLDEAFSIAKVQLGAYDAAVEQANRNENWSATGKRDSTLKFRPDAVAAVAAFAAAARKAADEVAAARAALFALPQLDQTDSAGAAYDREIRERFATLSEHQRAEALKDPRVVAALARDPFSTAPREAARAALNDLVEKTHADELAKLDVQAEHAQWGVVAAAAFGKLLTDTEAEWGPPRRTALDVANEARAAAAAPPPTPALKPVRDYKPVTMERAEEIAREIHAAENRA